MTQGTSKAGSTTRSSTAAAAPEGNTAVQGHGDHDRVAMLSLEADGTPDQTPGVEMIGDPEQAKAATAEQFRQQAVSAADVRLRGVTSVDGGAAEQVEQDPSVQKLIDEHEQVADAATKAAESTVDALHTGDAEKVPDTQPAKDSSS